MSNICQLTGKQPRFGHNVSHSNRKTARRYDVNIQKRSYYVPSLGRTVTLKLSARGIKTVDKIGIEAAIKRIQARGERV